MSYLLDLLMPELTPTLIGVGLIILGALILWQGFKYKFIQRQVWDKFKKVGLFFILAGVVVAFGLSVVINIFQSTELTIVAAMVLLSVLLILYLLFWDKRGRGGRNGKK